MGEPNPGGAACRCSGLGSPGGARLGAGLEGARQSLRGALGFPADCRQPGGKAPTKASPPPIGETTFTFGAGISASAEPRITTPSAPRVTTPRRGSHPVEPAAAVAGSD